MGLLSKIFGNTRKPEGFLGKLMVNGMNGGTHATMAKWALADFVTQEDTKALDIGCGGGANIARLLKKCKTVTGVDYSSVSVAKSIKVNKKAIEEGRCRVLEASVAALPFEAGVFDLVTAFETIYFWPSIEDSFRQVLRVLTPGGRFLIVNEDDGEHEGGVKWEKIIDGIHIYTSDELHCHLTAAGFSNIEVKKENRNLRVIAVK